MFEEKSLQVVPGNLTMKLEIEVLGSRDAINSLIAVGATPQRAEEIISLESYYAYSNDLLAPEFLSCSLYELLGDQHIEMALSIAYELLDRYEEIDPSELINIMRKANCRFVEELVVDPSIIENSIKRFLKGEMLSPESGEENTGGIGDNQEGSDEDEEGADN